MEVTSPSGKRDTPNISSSVPTVIHTNLTLPFIRCHSRLWMGMLLFLSDLISLLTAGVLAAFVMAFIKNGFEPRDFYIRSASLIVIFLVIYTILGLYPSVGLSPVEELRKLCVSTSFVFLVIAAMTFWMRNAESYSRLMIAFSWIFSIVLIQINRWLLRAVAIHFDVWGEPVAFIGYGPQGKQIADFLLKNLKFGLRPVIVLDGFYEHENNHNDIPKMNLGDPALDTDYLRDSGIKTVILITSEMPVGLQRRIFNEEYLGFDRVILISDLHWIGSVGVIPYNLQGFLGSEVQRNLVRSWDQGIKRVFDTIIVTVGGLFISPLLILITILVYLESKENIFYSHIRIGRGGKRIKVWKFRTMVPNADKILEEYLVRHPDLMNEWRLTQKIKDDPRVTRLGSFLRKYSLDELPQIWNVIKGEMSLVGPRPIVDEEVKHYGNSFHLYKMVSPGITGLWQVSGRNDVSYNLRVRLDEYYVRNWSIWLDLYILLRTPWIVLKKEGAY